MGIETSGDHRCVDCGSRLSGTDVEFCPNCLLRAALESGSDSSVEPGETRLEGIGAVAERRNGESADALIGVTVGAYRIDELVGRGGMGQVYKAWHTRLDRPVALKVLPGERLADPVRRRRFLREAKSASAHAHPNIVTVHDLIEEGGRDFLVMEFVDGPTLDRVIPRRGLPLDRALRYARQIAEGLRAAHEAGTIHRDVKPGNVMIAEGDVAKLVDFGLAKLADVDEIGSPPAGSELPTRTQLTRQGARVGTADYMSPEQALGEPVDHRSDIFSFGAVLYEMLTGSRPFAGPSRIAVMHNVVYKEPRPLARLARGAPREVRELVAKALAKSPGDRYASMGEVLAALAAAQERSETGGGALPTAARQVRGRAILAAGFVVLLAIVVVAVIPGSRDAVRDAARSLAGGWSTADDAAGVDSLDAYELHQRGEAYLERYDKEGHIDAAIDAFQRAIGKREDYAAAYSGLAAALRRKAFTTKDRVLLERAERRARYALELEPELHEAEVNLALVLIDLGEIDEARASLERVVRLDPGSAAAHRGLGDLAVAEGEPERAVDHYLRAIELEPADRELHGLLGSAHYRSGRFEQAADAYRRRVELAPDDVIGRKNLAAALHMLGDYQGAIRELQEAVKVRPDRGVYNNLGTLYFFQGLYEEAVRAFESALEHGAQDYRVWSNLGDAYRWTPGREDQAADAYLRAVQLVRKDLEQHPEDLTRGSRLALLLAKKGDLEEARLEAGRLADGAREDSRALYRLATVYELARERPRALELLETAFRGGYPMIEFERDPELAELRGSAAGQTMLARVEATLAVDR